MRKIAVANASGSAGKTTSVTSLATLGALDGRKVLIADLDPQGNASSWLGLKGQRPNIADVLLGDCNIADAIYPVTVPDDDGNYEEIPGLFLIPSDRSLTAALYDLEKKPKRDERLQRVCEAIDDIFDEAWFDCNGDLNLATMNGLIAADCVVSVTKPMDKEMEGWEDLIDMVNAVAEANGNKLTVEALIPCDTFKGNSGRAYVDGLDALKGTHGEVITTDIPHAVTQVEAYNRHIPLPLYVPKESVTKAYVKVRKELVERGTLEG